MLFKIFYILYFLILFNDKINARILTECEAANELRKSSIISETFIRHWVCLMKFESGLDTRFIKTNGPLASASYGVFQISSKNNEWCIKGRSGGKCNAKCEDFANDDISDDIICAEKIQSLVGFKYWENWMKKCKTGPLPDLNNCRNRRYSSFKYPLWFL